MSKRISMLAALASLALLVSFNSAFAAGDDDFIKEAAKGGMMEVKLGKLAVQNAASDQVKRFGQRMVDDHSKANDELKTIAKGKNVELPKEDDDKEAKDMSDKLSKLKGDAFDKAYITHMVADHEKDVAAFETEAKDGTDDEVKAFASKTLPVLKDHLSQAKKIADNMGGDAEKDGMRDEGAKASKIVERKDADMGTEAK